MAPVGSPCRASGTFTAQSHHSLTPHSDLARLLFEDLLAPLPLLVLLRFFVVDRFLLEAFAERLLRSFRFSTTLSAALRSG